MAGGLVTDDAGTTAAPSTEAGVLDKLRARFGPPAYGFLTHVPTGTGARASRTIDAIAMSLWPSRGYGIVGFEVKVSRGDWLRELKDPAKADPSFQCVDDWYVATPPDIIRPGELPHGWGHIVVRATGCRVDTPPAEYDPKHARTPINRAFLAALFRKIDAHSITQARLTEEIDKAYRAGEAKGHEQANPGYERLKVAHDSLMDKIRAFEDASGLQIIGGYHDRHRIADIVHALYNDNVRGRLVQELNVLTAASEAVGRALHELDTFDHARRRDREVSDGVHDADRSADPGV
jgi:hypothetical protein